MDPKTSGNSNEGWSQGLDTVDHDGDENSRTLDAAVGQDPTGAKSIAAAETVFQEHLSGRLAATGLNAHLEQLSQEFQEVVEIATGAYRQQLLTRRLRPGSRRRRRSG